jgi:ATP-binding cassette, subfamily B, bacterial
MVFLIVTASGLEMIYPLYLKKFINLLSATGVDKVTTIIELKNTLLALAAIYLIQWFLYRLATVSAAVFILRAVFDLGNYCYAYLHKHSYTFFVNNFAGSLVKRIRWFTSAFEQVVEQVLWNIIPLIVQVAVAFVILSGVNANLGLVMLIWVVVFFVFNIIFISFKLKYDKARNEAETAASGILADTIANHNNVKLFNGYDREVNLYTLASDKVRRLRTITWNYLSNSLDAVQGFLAITLEIGVLYYGIILWTSGRLSVGDFVLIQTLLINLTMRIWNIGRSLRNIYQSLSDAEEMTEILMTPHEIHDVPNAKKLKVTEGKIEFLAVQFNYNETRSILSDFNLTIAPRERIAVVGMSGAGKTTITKLILRLYELTAGKILIDGQDIAKMTQESVWQAVGLVPQDPDLFHRTLLENIRYGKPDATVEEIEAAAKAANCHEFISSLPNGYETLVGERGIKLSGGERQRVAIARAILRNAPILILDEATSSLDSESERLIQGALANLMKDKTVIIIAHRLSTIKQVDRIVVIGDGGIMEEGKHEELATKTGSLYSRLWKLQAGGFIQ